MIKIKKLPLTDRRFWIMTVLGFSSGLPLPLSGFTLRLWLTQDHLSLTIIGVTAVIGLSYSLKFLWAPFFDASFPPFLARFGRRRGWLLTTQFCLFLSLAALALSRPATAPAFTLIAAGAVAFCSASQDTVIDAWRIDFFPDQDQGAALACYIWGYRIALLISGSALIALSSPLGWNIALGIGALLALIGPLAVFFAEEPASRTYFSVTGNFLKRAYSSVKLPLRDFLTRKGAWFILAFIAVFYLGEAMIGIMLPPLYQHLGFRTDAIALANGPVSLVAVLIGVQIGGIAVKKAGINRSLIVANIFQTIALFMYFWLVSTPGNHLMLYVTSFTETFAEGMAATCFLAYLSALCNKKFSASQYAVFSSVATIPIRTVGSLTGIAASYLGWHLFFGLSVMAALPSMALMFYILKKYPLNLSSGTEKKQYT